MVQADGFEPTHMKVVLAARKSYEKVWKGAFCDIEPAFHNLESMVQTFRALGCPEEDMVLLKNPTSFEIHTELKALKNLAEETKDDSSTRLLTVFYYSGHGVTA